MTMTPTTSEQDRELLELAAKAAGADWAVEEDGRFEILSEIGGFSGYWNPLTDDGDALRLAVKLGIEWHKPSRSRSVGRVVQAWFALDGNPQRAAVSHVSEVVNGDPLAATRRAIVRAAAAIAKGEK